MAKAYVVVLVDIEDLPRYVEYSKKAGPIALKHGARRLVASFDVQPIEGDWPGRMVVLEFDSVDEARAWYDDPDYQDVAGERWASAKSMVAIVEGFVAPRE